MRGTKTRAEPTLRLPLPATSKTADRSNGAAPSFIVFTAALTALPSNSPSAVFLFISASVVFLAIYFLSPEADEETHPLLRKLPEVFTALGCILTILGIGLAFPKEAALIPLFPFIVFAALASLFRTSLNAWIVLILCGASVSSLGVFVVMIFYKTFAS